MDTEMREQIALLRARVRDLESKSKSIGKGKFNNVSNKVYVRNFVNDWYEKNHEMDIGVISIPVVGEIDILPDKVEKYIYEKIIHIGLSFVEQFLGTVRLDVLNRSFQINATAVGGETGGVASGGE